MGDLIVTCTLTLSSLECIWNDIYIYMCVCVCTRVRACIYVCVSECARTCTHTLVQTQSLVFCTNLSSEMEVCDYSFQCSCCHIVKKSEFINWTYKFYRGIQVQIAIPMNF